MSRGRTCPEHVGMPYQVDCPNCSRGIGYEWFEKYKDDVFPSDEVPVPGSGVFKLVPRYYEEIFKEEGALSLQEIKAVRQRFMKEHSDEYTPSRLMQKYKVKKAQVNLLKREYKK